MAIAASEPLFETGLLQVGKIDASELHTQLSRWVKAGKIHQLRRGLYTLAEPYQKQHPHPFLVANHLTRASYVSLQTALAYHGLIPESTPVITSVTTGRPGLRRTPIGVYLFHHIQRRLFTGYRQVDLQGGQKAFVASPEKALLDLIYLQPGGDTRDYLAELRLQNLEQVDLEDLIRLANTYDKPKIRRSVEILIDFAHQEAEGYRAL